MDSSVLTSYSSLSEFVETYAIRGDGLDSELAGAEIVDSSERVVVLDALLRKHYVWVTVPEVSEGTGLDESVVRDAVDAFVSAGVVREDDGKFRVDTSDRRVSEWRDVHKQMVFGDESE